VRCKASVEGALLDEPAVAPGEWHPSGTYFWSTPGRTRTCDPGIRNPMLYPAELRARERIHVDSTVSMYLGTPRHSLAMH
jgi:hypothetical protein